jgi:hypothetical protein
VSVIRAMDDRGSRSGDLMRLGWAGASVGPRDGLA